MPATYPLQKKGHTLEFLREISHLRVRSNTFGAAFRVRNALTHAIHTFFQERDFLYVQTPIITTSDCEGAGQMFGVTTLNLQQPPRAADGKVDWQQDFFAKPAYLTVSGQLEGEIFASAFSKVYTFRPDVSRREQQYAAPLGRVLDDRAGNGFLRARRQHAAGRGVSEIHYSLLSSNTAAKIWSSSINSSRSRCWRRWSMSPSPTSATSPTPRRSPELKKSGKTWEFPVEWGNDLQTEHERFLSEEVFKKPLIVTDYPKAIKAFYMRANDDGKTVRAMDVLVPRVGEIIGGSQREERHDVLLQRLHDAGLDEKPYWWYLDLRRYGTVPHSGFGLGLERMMMYLTGLKNIRDVIPFPRTPGNAEF